ncbi:hypothetical protein BC829DRAFT_395577 [Chytridium lagenaria]|nr:hypothetical protein BC829DRAFT_395577 [Chytridium lagenaria]
MEQLDALAALLKAAIDEFRTTECDSSSGENRGSRFNGPEGEGTSIEETTVRYRVEDGMAVVCKNANDYEESVPNFQEETDIEDAYNLLAFPRDFPDGKSVPGLGDEMVADATSTLKMASSDIIFSAFDLNNEVNDRNDVLLCMKPSSIASADLRDSLNFGQVLDQFPTSAFTNDEYTSHGVVSEGAGRGVLQEGLTRIACIIEDVGKAGDSNTSSPMIYSSFLDPSGTTRSHEAGVVNALDNCTKSLRMNINVDAPWTDMYSELDAARLARTLKYLRLVKPRKSWES